MRQYRDRFGQSALNRKLAGRARSARGRTDLPGNEAFPKLLDARPGAAHGDHPSADARRARPVANVLADEERAGQRRRRWRRSVRAAGRRRRRPPTIHIQLGALTRTPAATRIGSVRTCCSIGTAGAAATAAAGAAPASWRRVRRLEIRWVGAIVAFTGASLRGRCAGDQLDLTGIRRVTPYEPTVLPEIWPHLRNLAEERTDCEAVRGCRAP